MASAGLPSTSCVISADCTSDRHKGVDGKPSIALSIYQLPGSNALIFAQRYRALEAEVTAATVISTVLYVATAPLWLAVLARVSPW